VASLTPSELQVAGLAAGGMTTPQIAGRLHVTANTVETHLRHIYQKLSVSGRRELPSALEQAVQTGS
jgi:DNA-binding CsgD family transcriptional regulator